MAAPETRSAGTLLLALRFPLITLPGAIRLKQVNYFDNFRSNY